MPVNRHTIVFLLMLLAGFAAAAAAAEIPAPRAYRVAEAVTPVNETTVIAEAEEFAPLGTGDAVWRARPWGENYYAATMANVFLSRKAFLGAPEQIKGADATASISVQVPKAGRYLALVRYEAAPKFHTRFKLRIEQGGAVKLDRLYGLRESLKIWAFSQKLKPEVAWTWGAVENVVWEGHDAFVDLAAGPATLTLAAGEQPEPAARRNVDLVMLTSDAAQVNERIEKEGYLPLDGMLTQAGDLYIKLHNPASSPAMKLTVSPCTEHSPYWVHQRNWKPLDIPANPGQSTEWIDVGGQLDSLNDGQWNLKAAATGPQAAALKYSIEFGVRRADGQIESIRKFDDLGAVVDLAYFADTRYSRRIIKAEDVLYELVDHLKKTPVAAGTPPKRTLIYGYSFSKAGKDARYVAAVDEFRNLMGTNALMRGTDDAMLEPGGIPRGYIDLRGQSPDQLKQSAAKLKAEGKADKIAVVSLGDEIGLEAPKPDDHATFRTWLQSRNLKPADVDPAAANWDAITYNPAANEALKSTKPGVFYYSRLYDHHFGIAAQKRLTDALKTDLPNAGIGANFSPHHGHAYLGETYQWVSLFRESGMTMPWGEDYIWQVPVGSQQMNFLCLDLFRAGTRHQPTAKIHYYVMPHSPGNTPNGWRRQFYGALGHGMKIVNLFEFQPVQAAYTENHVTGNAMYDAVRTGLHELGSFEDLVQDGAVRPGLAGLWFSETGDIWNDNRAPFDAAKRTLYCAIRHQQLPLDVVVEQDALDGTLKNYRVLYLTDQHVSRAASTAIAEWTNAGGHLFATAGAGMFDELNQPNATLRGLLGVDQQSLDEPPADPVKLEKQDLPFARNIDRVNGMAVVDVRSHITAAGGANVQGKFSDNLPAIMTRSAGKGTATYCAFLPGLSYFRPALPLRPVDRGSTDDSMSHFIPTAFDATVAKLIAAPATDIPRPVTCSNPLVETTLIDSPDGVLIPLINWTPAPIPQLTVKLNFDPPTGVKPRLASGKPLKPGPDARTFTLDLEIADAVVLDRRGGK